MISEALIAAVMMVESGGDPNAIGDHHRARGAFQIHAAAVRDVNRFYGTQYTHRQMHDPQAARDVFVRYLRIYVTPRRLGRQPTAQDYARCWNGGPDGWREPETVTYWHRVRRHIESGQVSFPQQTTQTFTPCPKIIITLVDSQPNGSASSSADEIPPAIPLESKTSTQTTGSSTPPSELSTFTFDTRTARRGTVFIAAVSIAPGSE